MAKEREKTSALEADSFRDSLAHSRRQFHSLAFSRLPRYAVRQQRERESAADESVDENSNGSSSSRDDR